MADIEEVEENGNLVNEVRENMDFSKFKVADLKKELKARGLSTTGNKTELLERLHLGLQEGEGLKLEGLRHGVRPIHVSSTEHESYLVDSFQIGQEEGNINLENDSGAADSEEVLDEDDVLADVAEEVLDDDISKEVDIKAVAEDLKESLDEPGTEKQAAKKIVLKRVTSITSVEKENQETAKEPDKKVIKLTELSAKERIERRAQKFGAAVSDDARKAARAARFGIAAGNTQKTGEGTEILQKRAERFGTVATVGSTMDLDERMRKRRERFGLAEPDESTKKTFTKQVRLSVTAPIDDELEEKKRKRAERFKTNK